MDFLNIGSGEFLFLILLAILLVGPRRAAEWVQQATRFAARLQQEWRAVQRDVLQELRTLQQETTQAVQPALREAREAGARVRQETQGALEEVTVEAQEARERLRAVLPPVSPEIPPPSETLGGTDDLAG